MSKYGFSDSKCKYEVVDKNNIVVLEGTITISASSNNKFIYIDYPEGLNADNCVLISRSIKNIAYEVGVWSYDTSFIEGEDREFLDVSLREDGEISLRLYSSDIYSHDRTFIYKLVLYKYID